MTVSMNNYFNKVRVQNGYFSQTIRVGFAGPQGTPGPSQPHISNLKISGHSYTDFGFPQQDEQNPSNIFWGEQDYFGARLKEVFGVDRGHYHNIGVSGNTARDGYFYTLQYEKPDADWPYLADTGVACVLFGANDQIAGITTPVLNSFKEGMRAIIGRYIAAKVYEYNNFDTYGQFVLDNEDNWKDVRFDEITDLTPSKHGSGDGYWSTSTVGAYLTFDTPPDINSSYIHIGFIAGVQGADVNIYVDDVLTTTTTTYNLNPLLASTTARTHRLVRVPITPAGRNGLDNDGQHTIKVECAGVTSSGAMQVNYWQIEAKEHPIVLVSDAIQPSNGQSLWAGMQDPNVMKTYNTYIQDLIDEWDSQYIVLVPANDELDGDYDTWYVNKNAQYFNGDGLHPNGWGSVKLAKAFYNAATAIISNGGDSSHFNWGWSMEMDPLYEETNHANRLYVGAGTPFTIDEFNQGFSDNGLGGDWIELSGTWGRTSAPYLGKYLYGVTTHTHFLRSHSGAAALQTFGNDPATLIDNFTRADSTTTLTAPWSTVSGTFGIENFKAVCLSAGKATLETSITDHFVESKAQFGTSSGNGVMLKYVDANNYMKVIYSGAFVGWEVYEVVAGVATQLDTGFNISADIIRAECSGSTLYIIGTSGIITSVAIPVALAGGTKVGLIGANTSGVWHNFKYGEVITVSDNAYCLAVIDTGFSDGYCGIRGSDKANNFTGIVFRVQDKNNFYLFLFAPAFGAVALGKVVAGTYSSIAPGVLGGLATEDFVYVYMNGNNFEVHSYKEDGTDTLIVSATDSEFPTGTQHGMYMAPGQFNWESKFSGFGYGENFFIPFDGDMYIDYETGYIYGPYDADTPNWNRSAYSIGGGTGSLVTSVDGYSGAVTGMLYYANNLSDVQSVSLARSNLGLGALAVLNQVTESEIDTAYTNNLKAFAVAMGAAL